MTFLEKKIRSSSNCLASGSEYFCYVNTDSYDLQLCNKTENKPQPSTQHWRVSLRRMSVNSPTFPGINMGLLGERKRRTHWRRSGRAPFEGRPRSSGRWRPGPAPGPAAVAGGRGVPRRDADLGLRWRAASGGRRRASGRVRFAASGGPGRTNRTIRWSGRMWPPRSAPAVARRPPSFLHTAPERARRGVSPGRGWGRLQGKCSCCFTKRVNLTGIREHSLWTSSVNSRNKVNSFNYEIRLINSLKKHSDGTGK